MKQLDFIMLVSTFTIQSVKCHKLLFFFNIFLILTYIILRIIFLVMLFLTQIKFIRNKIQVKKL